MRRRVVPVLAAAGALAAGGCGASQENPVSPAASSTATGAAAASGTFDAAAEGRLQNASAAIISFCTSAAGAPTPEVTGAVDELVGQLKATPDAKLSTGAFKGQSVRQVAANVGGLLVAKKCAPDLAAKVGGALGPG